MAKGSNVSRSFSSIGGSLTRTPRAPTAPIRLFKLSVLAVLAACGGSSADPIPGPGAGGTTGKVDDTGNTGGVAAPPTTECRATAAIASAPAADARARQAFPIQLAVGDEAGMKGPRPVKLMLYKGGAEVATLLDAPRELGKVDVLLNTTVTADLATGAYTLTATVGCPANATQARPAMASAPLHLVRLGVTAIDVRGGDGARGELMYHAVDHVYRSSYPISSVVAATLVLPQGEPEIDDAKGVLRAFAKPWDDLETPPVDGTGAVLEKGATLPVSLTVGTRPDVLVTIGKSARGPQGVTQPTGLDVPGAPAVRVAIAGAYAQGVKEGATLAVRLKDSPVPSVNRVDHPLVIKFEARNDANEWVEIPGVDVNATLRLYGVLGNTQGASVPNLPWVAVVDEATRAVGGKAADAAAVRAALVKHVYEGMGLSYDRASGASHYTAYSSGYGSAGFRLARLLRRDNGTVINCSDCASILTTFSNMIGASLKYAIIGFDFPLNPILGIGATSFGSPFNSGRLSFSYHAVTSRDAAATINDATLAVDGDADPKAAPQTKLLVQNLTGADYLSRLSPGTPTQVGYKYVDKTTTNTY